MKWGESAPHVADKRMLRSFSTVMFFIEFFKDQPLRLKQAADGVAVICINRRDTFRVIESHIVHLAGDEMHHHFFRREWAKDIREKIGIVFVEILVGTIEPAVVIVRLHNHGHSIVNRFE